MLITRSPLRITLGGGGSDVSSYSNKYDGFCLSAAISKYSYVAINHLFKEGISLKYSETETPKNILDIQHPIFRESLKWIGLNTPQVEIVSIADVPSNGSGMGSSGAFTVALLKALHDYKNIPLSPEEIANIACTINMDILGKIQGKQDEYASALGGMNCLKFNRDGSVEHKALKITHDTMIQLEENLMLFYTGISHSTEEILSYQDKNSNEEDMVSNLHEVKQVGYDAKSFLEHGNTKAFADLLNVQWRLKENRMPIKNSFLEELHYGSLEHGAIGSKIIGSGNGGFVLLYSENKNKLRQYMKLIGLEELRFSFDFEGCKRMV